MSILASALWLLAMASALQHNGVAASLVLGYYNTSCPDLESIVESALEDTVQYDAITIPALLRLHFHDCIVPNPGGGMCDGSILLQSTSNMTTEKDAPLNSNLALVGFDAIDYIKAAVEATCPGVVSCADILALAARDSVVLAGGPTWNVPLGRYDSMVSYASSVPTKLPQQDMNITQLLSIFTNAGLNLTDMVTLSGAHTIGFAHCNSFINRLYNYPNSTTGSDPTMNVDLVGQLQNICPNPTKDPSLVAPLDVNTITNFDYQYFRGLRKGFGVLTSDQELWLDSRTSPTVTALANSQTTFFTKWKQAIVKMSSLGVLNATQGQIRVNDCKANN